MRPLSLKTILVATDAVDDDVLPALRSAAELARLADARLYVIHATERSDETEARVLDQLNRAGIAPDAPTEIIVEPGPPGAIVGQEARRLGADVVFLGPHRRERGDLAGSTADRVVHIAAVPCLILPVQLPLPLDRVLAPVDSSDGARGALAVAMTWASALRPRGKQAELAVLHVTPRDATDSALQAALDREVDLVRDQLAGAARLQIRTIADQSDTAADTILKRARTESTDLIVIGTRRTSLSTAAMLGSVSSGVVRRARCPVLLVPPEVWTAESPAT